MGRRAKKVLEALLLSLYFAFPYLGIPEDMLNFSDLSKVSING
jgi:hypothetical protein